MRTNPRGRMLSSVVSRLAPTRTQVAVTLLLTLALWANAQFLIQTIRVRAGSEPQDLASYYQVRFSQLRPLLPHRGIVGYVSDDLGAAREYYLTQYALAPLVLDQTSSHAVVVGNFFDPAAAPAIAARRKLVLVRDFGEGVMLFRGPGS